MPFKFVEINAQPDIASNNRYTVYFPAIAGLNLRPLSYLVKHITVPQNGVAHIIVRLFSSSIGFRGDQQFDNQMSITFEENVRGDALGTIEDWLKTVRNNNGNSLRKFGGYAGDGKLDIYDTTGGVIHTIPLINMFPLTIDYPELDEGGSAPLEFTVTFNVDSAKVYRGEE